MTLARVDVAQSVLNKAGAFGLHHSQKRVAELLKRMARLSAIASGNFNEQRRRYGSFILTVRDGTLVDINCNEESYCVLCLGIGVDEEGDDCICAHPGYDTSDPVVRGHNNW